MSDNARMLDKLAELVAGSGARDLSVVEARARRFCPFEAVGMARQEIRHSNFLAYILDPHRPHGLGDAPLRGLLNLLLGGEGMSARDRLRLHFMDLGPAEIYRERDRIDLMVVIPSTEGKGVVIAIEVKVDAWESEDQLTRYERALKARFPKRSWQYIGGFLTPDGRDPETAGQLDWRAISFDALAESMDREIAGQGGEGLGLDMYQSYKSMMRRQGVMSGTVDEELNEAIRKIWSEHREALEFLQESRPTPVQDAMREVSAEIAVLQHSLDKAYPGEFHVEKGWTGASFRVVFPIIQANFPEIMLAAGTWSETGGILALEAYAGPKDSEAWVAITLLNARSMPDDQKPLRIKLFDALNTVSPESNQKRGVGLRYFWRDTLFSEDDLLRGAEPTELAKEKLVGYLGEHIAAIRTAVESACAD